MKARQQQIEAAAEALEKLWTKNEPWPAFDTMAEAALSAAAEMEKCNHLVDARMVEWARAEEREACAKVADRFYTGEDVRIAVSIADAIRARKDDR